jgi:hypothetical protein
VFSALDEVAYSVADIALSPLVVGALWLLYRAVRPGLGAQAARDFDIGFTVHVLSALAMAFVYWPYYGGDMTSYYRFSVPLSEALRVDFAQFAPEFVTAFFQGEAALPSELVGGTATGSMNIFVATCFYFLFDSVVGTCLLLGGLAFLSKLLTYQAMAPELTERHQMVLRRSLLFLPTGVIWVTVLMKEAVAVAGVGPVLFGLRRIGEGRWVVGLLLLVPGAIAIAMIKPYVLMGLLLGVGAWVVRKRAWPTDATASGPLFAVVGIVGVIGGLVLMGRLFPDLAVDRVVSRSAQQRVLASRDEGGSNFVVDEGEAVEDIAQGTADVSLASQARVLPTALIATFFRPFLFEVRNPMQLMNAMETTVLLYMALRAARAWRQLLRFVFSSPASMGASVMVMVQAIGVGLSTSNLGTLSRYRAPMMPYAVFLLVCAYLDERAADEEVQRRPGVAGA